MSFAGYPGFQKIPAYHTANKKLKLLTSITRHNIKNQLMALLGYIELSKEKSTDPEMLHFIEREDAAAQTIHRQIEFTKNYEDIGVQLKALRSLLSPGEIEDARKIYDTPHAMAVVITLLPGGALKKHITPVDVFFYVREGTGIVEIGDEKMTAVLVESPAKIPHKWTNEIKSAFWVLVVKVPKPTEETKLL